jgi:EAL domain-containing protein (putative c-di-GMP-specific phosphodiesterase class I)
VETAREARVLTDLGCDHLQGFYFGRPERSALSPRSELLPQAAGIEERVERRRLGGRG